jgi:hypothetical protein
MAAFIDRLRMFMFGNLTKWRLRNKIGISAAVSWLRHGGMIPISAHNSVSFLGASAVSSENGSGEFDPDIRIGIEKDKIGLQSIRAIMNRALELAAIIKNKEGIDRKK